MLSLYTGRRCESRASTKPFLQVLVCIPSGCGCPGCPGELAFVQVTPPSSAYEEDYRCRILLVLPKISLPPKLPAAGAVPLVLPAATLTWQGPSRVANFWFLCPLAT